MHSTQVNEHVNLNVNPSSNAESVCRLGSVKASIAAKACGGQR